MADTDDAGLIYLSDMEGRNLYSSPAMYAFTGRPAGADVGEGWRMVVHPDDLEHIGTFTAAVRQSRQSFAGWWRLRKHDGTYPWVLIGGMPFISEISGLPIGYLGSLHPLERADAFVRAGGVVGPDERCVPDPKGSLPRVEKIADLTLMASAMARESGEADIAHALDEALASIGFRLAQLMRGAAEPAQHGSGLRRRIAVRG